MVEEYSRGRAMAKDVRSMGVYGKEIARDMGWMKPLEKGDQACEMYVEG